MKTLSKFNQIQIINEGVIAKSSQIDQGAQYICPHVYNNRYLKSHTTNLKMSLKYLMFAVQLNVFGIFY